jgi:RNA polymerase sigma factor (sigma-70 family)
MTQCESDRRLVDGILAGILTAWHEFVERYSSLIYATLRTHLIAEDEDEVRGAYVDLLYSLYHGKLASFEGRSKLSTWLVLVARNAAFDRLRQLYGRGRPPAGWQALDPVTREVYRLAIVEGLSFDFVRRMARPAGPPLDEPELLEAMAHVRSLPRQPRRRRLRGRDGVSGCPKVSAREYALHLQLLSEEGESGRDPEAALARREIALVHRRLIRELRGLPMQERRVLYLRFWRKLTARAIAKKLGFTKERQAYTSIDRALRKLRVAVERE